MKAAVSQNPLASPAGRLVFVITLLLIGIMAARSPLDSDVWWHLRSGQVMVETGRPLMTDVFSFTRGGQSWINHSWLSQVILYGSYQLAGYAGLSLWVTVLAVLSIGLLFFQMSGPAGWRVLLLILGAVAAAPVWSPRPQLVTLVLFVVLAGMMQRWRRREMRRLWLLPVLFCLWSNLHGGFSIGFLLLLAFFAGQLFNHLAGYQEYALPWRSLGIIGVWTLAAALAVMINPNGLNMWRIPFQTVGVGSLQQFIQEWASPDFHDAVQQPVLLIIGLLIGSVGFSGKKLDGVDWVTSFGFLVLALLARRNIAPFALVAMPVIAQHGWLAIQNWREKIQLPAWMQRLNQNESPSKAHPAINLLLAGLIGLVMVGKLGVVSLPPVVESASAGLSPQAAVDWLKEHPTTGRMLSEYGWGGYLDWNLPDEKVFVDGRTDLFGDEIIGQWLQVVQAGSGMMEILDRWEIQRVMLEPGRPAVSALQAAGWRSVYQDSSAVILERPGQ